MPKPATPVPEVVEVPEIKPTVREAAAESKQAPAQEDPYKDLDCVVLSHCDNPAQFYVHPIDQLSKLNQLHENLQIVSPLCPS